MTLARSDTPLRRSEVGSFRRSVAAGVQQRPAVVFNDDEEERRNARRQTLLQQEISASSSSIEDNETIKRCLEMHSTNKFSRDNAWSTSMIDILANLLERHRRSLKNFKVAGSSLEASSKIYGLRVDSLHTDIMRMAAGLNAKKFSEQGDAETDLDEQPTARPDEAEAVAADKPKPKKRVRRIVSTVTKNKETLNARLDTLPLQDPIFGKLNTIIGSDNSSNRLMNNVLPTKDSELLLRTNYRFWDASDLPEGLDYTEELRPACFAREELVSADWVPKLAAAQSELVLRGHHTGYVISDTPRPNDSSAEPPSPVAAGNVNANDNEDDDNNREYSMAFDLNAECEPMPELNEPPPGVVELLGFNNDDNEELEVEVTQEDREMLKVCRGILKPAVFIDDLRPVDGRSQLEYSYRPMDKISQFWAGPSHWKFKKPRSRSTMQSQHSELVGGVAQRAGRRPAAHSKRTAKLNFGVYQESNFVSLDEQIPLRRANFHKKWDARKLRLPVDMKIDREIFAHYVYAPSLTVHLAQPVRIDDDDEDEDDNNAAHFNEFADDDVENAPLTLPDDGQMGGATAAADDNVDCGDGAPFDDGLANEHDSAENACNTTVLEIATEYAGAPVQVTKIVVPFAKRAKVIDMKNLKRTCSHLISGKLRATQAETATAMEPTAASQAVVHPTIKHEDYIAGVASFKNVYEQLPTTLTPSMAEAVTPSIALYSVLHLSNDQHLRLFPQDDLTDFKIRQIAE